MVASSSHHTRCWQRRRRKGKHCTFHFSKEKCCLDCCSKSSMQRAQTKNPLTLEERHSFVVKMYLSMPTVSANAGPFSWWKNGFSFPKWPESSCVFQLELCVSEAAVHRLRSCLLVVEGPELPLPLPQTSKIKQTTKRNCT